MRGFVIVLAVSLAALCLPGKNAAAEISADQIAKAKKATFGSDSASLDKSYQATLPRYDFDEPEAGSGGSGRLGSGGGSQGSNDGIRRRPKRQGGGAQGRDQSDRDYVSTRDERQARGESPLMQMVMWGLIIVVAVLFAFWIAKELATGGKDAELPPAEDSQTKMAAQVDSIIDKPLGDADQLAAQGLFAEAIHTLLLRTLQELVRSAAVRIAPAMTSREILARVPLLAEAREALTDLIIAVELTHFGDEPAGAADYQKCREKFNLFAAALRSSAQRQPGPTALAGGGTALA